MLCPLSSALLAFRAAAVVCAALWSHPTAHAGLARFVVTVLPCLLRWPRLPSLSSAAGP